MNDLLLASKYFSSARYAEIYSNIPEYRSQEHMQEAEGIESPVNLRYQSVRYGADQHRIAHG